MSDLSQFFGPNAGYIQEQYEEYLKNPESASLDSATRSLFAQWRPLSNDAPAQKTNGFHPVGEVSTVVSSPGKPLTGSELPEEAMHKIVETARLARFIRHRGHQNAHLDPLSPPPPDTRVVDLQIHNVTNADLKSLPSSIIRGPIAIKTQNADEAIEMLRQVYSGSIGFDFEHIQIHEERKWLRNAVESQEFLQRVTNEDKLKVLNRLADVDGFERFLQKSFPNTKRFSIEGSDMLVPILDEIIECCTHTQTRSITFGMAHRGRLNVLANVLRKPYHAIFAEFSHSLNDEDEGPAVSGKGAGGWTGDVKYHKGEEYEYKEMSLSLVPNPSHLEFVNPVVEGHVRAAQDMTDKPGTLHQNFQKSLAVLIHGDAAYPGQGIVAETLNMSQLPGYSTGGTIHIIVNNQIGFMTTPEEGRSTHYSSDLAKGFEMPIVHVNGDDPVACIAVAKMAHAYRELFHKDFLIDLIGYRRFGHNESEEPAYTQPQMYQTIRAYPRLQEIWSSRMVGESLISQAAADKIVKDFEVKMSEELLTSKNFHEVHDDDYLTIPVTETICTQVSEERLRGLNQALYSYPAGFTVNEKLDRNVFAKRREGLDTGLIWGHAEALAFASILEDGTPIRLSGQEAQPGTFSHRHSVLHDSLKDQEYVPLQNLPTAKGSFSVYNSPLSENSILGFEYGYSMHNPKVLVLWEAQFGDFVNGAQVIVDQFLVSSYAKWQQTPSLVLLLPHGYEGQGPEHSNARPERFLQLCANDNIQVVNCTTPAQIFHVLRRQAALLEIMPRPLVIMSPKSLLKDPSIASKLSELTAGKFQKVIGDPISEKNADNVTRLSLCSGKIYVDLMKSFTEPQPASLAIGRIEQLYPFPKDEIIALITKYPNLKEIVWFQEEPKNMGAWSFIETRLREIYGAVSYIGRPESASPAEGSKPRHDVEQARILREVALGFATNPAKSETSRRRSAAAKIIN